MPARQRGFARKRGSFWLAVWRENGRERSRSGFSTKTEALDYANAKAEQSVAAETAIRFGDRVTPPASFSTVSELADAFLARYRADEATRRTFRARLKHATAAFGDRPLQTLQPIELDVWRSTLPQLSAHYIFRSFRQVLEYAVAMGVLDANPAARIRNTRAADGRREMRPFES